MVLARTSAYVPRLSHPYILFETSPTRRQAPQTDEKSSDGDASDVPVAEASEERAQTRAKEALKTGDEMVAWLKQILAVCARNSRSLQRPHMHTHRQLEQTI